MIYTIVLLAMLLAGLAAYLTFSRKPRLEPLTDATAPLPPEDTPSAPGVMVSPLTMPEKILSSWDTVLVEALDYLYGCEAKPPTRSSHPMFQEPASTVTALSRSLAKAFERVGTLHSSLSAVDDPEISMKKLGDLVTHDPVLSARVLKTVNSPFFRLAHDVKSIHTAVNILGLTHLKNLIAFGTMPYDLYTNAEHRRMFKAIWQHMNNTAITAAAIAKARHDMDSGMLYTAGLMHDIGKLLLILCIHSPEKGQHYPATLEEEFELAGATHLHMARTMAEGGGIPEQLRILVLGHHLPSLVPVGRLDCSAEQVRGMTLLFLANQIAKLITGDGDLHDEFDHLEQLEPSYHEVIPKEEACRILLNRGFIKDVLANVRVVQSTLD